LSEGGRSLARPAARLERGVRGPRVSRSQKIRLKHRTGGSQRLLIGGRGGHAAVLDYLVLTSAGSSSGSWVRFAAEQAR
jgi:hypothetical protein